MSVSRRLVRAGADPVEALQDDGAETLRHVVLPPRCVPPWRGQRSRVIDRERRHFAAKPPAWEPGGERTEPDAERCQNFSFPSDPRRPAVRRLLQTPTRDGDHIMRTDVFLEYLDRSNGDADKTGLLTPTIRQLIAR